MMDDDRSSDARIPSEGWAEIEAAEREVERKDAASQQKLEQQAKDPAIQRGVEARFVEQLDEYLGPAADAIAAMITRLAEELAKLDLISEENPGLPRWRVDLGTGELVDGIEVAYPEPRLYMLVGHDTLVASRIRTDGRREHAVLDEHGQPTEWRLAIRPELN